MVQTVSYSKLLTGLNFVDLLPIGLNFMDLIYTTKTTKIYTPRNLIRLRVVIEAKFTLIQPIFTTNHHNELQQSSLEALL